MSEDYIISEEELMRREGVTSYLSHYGILRKSGRYPWGSGGKWGSSDDSSVGRSTTFMDQLAKLRSEGVSDTDIASGFGMTVKELRETNTIAIAERRASDVARAVALRDHGHSPTAIGEKMGLNESSVRGLLARSESENQNILATTADMLREKVDGGAYLDVGKGVENNLGISKEKLGSAVAILKDEGYTLHNIQIDTGNQNQKTTSKVLCPPGTVYKDVANNQDRIVQLDAVGMKSDNGGRTFYGMLPPKSVASSRVQVVYDEDGGSAADGLMYIRPGKEDLSLGGSRYAQVRVLVDGTHYLKGMAIYKDDLPTGVDIQFNTNKSRAKLGDNKLKAMKPIADDEDNPFGAVVDQIGKRDKNGDLTKLTSAMNIVNKEGDWEGWKKSIASQVLSKQSPALAKEQLAIAADKRRKEYDEILNLTNPAVRQNLLKSFADSADSASVNLKAAALKEQASHVILPMNKMKETEVYAPNYVDGTRVALVRYPHGGKFEIPELTVNNRVPAAKALIGQVRDAIGINSKVAERMSGADFDGDTVLVIPNNQGKIKSAPALDGLKGFDPQKAYPAYEGMPKMSPRSKQTQMGIVSNLITDMTIQGANSDELARAVRHSMVVIDAEKHNLNYRESAKRNGIAALQKKYQAKADGTSGGAATLISRASSEQRVRARDLRSMKDGGPIDKATGRKVYVDRDGWVDKDGVTRYSTMKSTKLAEANDARSLLSKDGGTAIEKVYADYSNSMKALANEARKSLVNTPSVRRSPDAARQYKPEVDALNAKLNRALQNAPRERQARLLANARVDLKTQANPDLSSDQVKRIRAQALSNARVVMNARKEPVVITDREWAAIQAGAISHNKLKKILDNTDIEQVKALATPRKKLLMEGANLARAKAMAAQGRTQAEIAQALGISVTTVKEGLK